MPRRVLQGTVVSVAGQKTISVLVERRVMHPIYKKYINRSKKYLAHDENGVCQKGAVVRIVERNGEPRNAPSVSPRIRGDPPPPQAGEEDRPSSLAKRGRWREAKPRDGGGAIPTRPPPGPGTSAGSDAGRCPSLAARRRERSGRSSHAGPRTGRTSAAPVRSAAARR